MPDAMIDRLIQFYQRHESNQEESLGPIWEHIRDTTLYPLHRALLDGAQDEIGKLLTLQDDQHLGYGLTFSFFGEQMLSGLAVVSGLTSLVNPAQPDGVGRTATAADVESKTGIPIIATDATKSFMHAELLLTAKRLYPRPNRVLEIGGGLGTLAIQLLAMSPQTNGYCMVDLPLVCVIQAYNLAAQLGASKVALCGEQPGPDCRVYIIPATETATIHGPFDWIINTDSLPELPREEALKYFELIRTTLEPEGCFLSFNHESNACGQCRVYDYASQFPDLKQRLRYPSITRSGYLIEIWEKR